MPPPCGFTTRPQPKQHSLEHAMGTEKPRDTSYLTNGSKTKRRPESNVFRRLGVIRKRQRRTADIGPDYTQRWPTVTTLLEQHSDSWVSLQEEGDQEAPIRPVKVKALRAIAAPLAWLNVKIEGMQEHLDYKILLSEARAQKRASQSSSRKNSEQPGQSTHPYDTGIQETINEEEEETSRRGSQGPRPASQFDACSSSHDAQETRPAMDNKSTLQPWKKIRFCGRSDGDPPSSPHNSAVAGLSTTDTNHSPTFRYNSDVSVLAQIDAGPKTSSRTPWRNRFSINTRRAEPVQALAPSHESVNVEFDEEDVVSTVKPRRAWKRTKDRRGSTYPDRRLSKRKSQDSNEQSATSQQKDSSRTAPSKSPFSRTVVKKVSKPKISLGSAPQPTKVKSSPPRPALPQQASKQPAVSGAQRRRSSTNCPAGTGTNSSKSCTPALCDSAIISPRAGAFRHLLGLVKDSPPSRAISPLEIDETDAPNPRTHAPLTTLRRSTDTTTSSRAQVAHTARTQSNEIKVADKGSTPSQKKEGGWLAMAQKFGISSKEHAPEEPVTQLSRLETTPSTREGQTSSRRASGKGNEVRAVEQSNGKKLGNLGRT